jgi:hypothetical protein
MPIPEPTPIASQISPEAELLLACARTTIDAAGAARIERLLQRDLVWDDVIALARRHAVVPLLYTALQRGFAQMTPLAVLEALRAHYLAGAQQSMALTAELLRLLKLFDQAGIEVLPLKGPALAMLAYGNLSLRWSSDLDILVRPQDVPAAKSILVAQGYHSDPPMTERQEALRLRTHYVYAFVHEASSVCVELHYRFRPRYFVFDFSSEQLWSNLESVAVGGATLPHLAPADLLVFLCAHGANHCWERLAWICDIAELIRTQRQLDWEAAQRRARELGCERMLLLGLRLAHELLGAAIPEAILQRAGSERATRSLAESVRNNLFDPSFEAPGLFAGTLFHLRARERWRDRVLYCLRLATVTTSEDWNLLPLPAPLAWVYSLIRPVRLALTYGLGPLRRLYARAARG